jgi:hypothetical protein
MDGRTATLAIDESIGMLAYRSRAVVAPTDRELDLLLSQAQGRNRAELLSGLLIYDQGCYFQWLEGPQEALQRVWGSIQRDPRHRDVQVLREEAMPKRFFGDWDMRLARRARGNLDKALAVLETPEDLLKRVRVLPSGLGTGAWDDIFADIVVPQLRNRHLTPHPMPHRVAALWHAEIGAAEELAARVLGVNEAPVAEYLDGLVAEGASPEVLYEEVFEPAARYLGDLRDEDLRSELEVTLGLGRLQFAVRQLSASLGQPLYAIRPGHAVLVAPEPGEPHGLAAAMASELFWRDGWDVSCEFPSTDGDLGRLVHDRWFDVLELSLSTAIRRERAMTAMGITIKAAQAASLNPALMIIVDGRAFVERQRTYRDVGADAGCVSVVESVPAAHRLLATLAGGPQNSAKRSRARTASAAAPESRSRSARSRAWSARRDFAGGTRATGPWPRTGRRRLQAAAGSPTAASSNRTRVKTRLRRARTPIPRSRCDFRRRRLRAAPRSPAAAARCRCPPRRP